MGFFKFLTSKSFFIQLVIAGVLVILIAFGLLKYLDYTTNHGETIIVPQLSKMTIDEAAPVLKDKKLDIHLLDTVEYRPNVPPYSIVEQDPRANSEVKLGRKIYVKINSGGYSNVVLPEFENKTYRQLLANILSLGLKEGKIIYKPHFAKDIVMALKQNGKALKMGDKIQKNSTIDFILGDGKESFESMPEELMLNDSIEDTNTIDPILNE